MHVLANDLNDYNQCLHFILCEIDLGLLLLIYWSCEVFLIVVFLISDSRRSTSWEIHILRLIWDETRKSSYREHILYPDWWTLSAANNPGLYLVYMICWSGIKSRCGHVVQPAEGSMFYKHLCAFSSRIQATCINLCAWVALKLEIVVNFEECGPIVCSIWGKKQGKSSL